MYNTVLSESSDIFLKPNFINKLNNILKNDDTSISLYDSIDLLGNIGKSQYDVSKFKENLLNFTESDSDIKLSPNKNNFTKNHKSSLIFFDVNKFKEDLFNFTEGESDNKLSLERNKYLDSNKLLILPPQDGVRLNPDKIRELYTITFSDDENSIQVTPKEKLYQTPPDINQLLKFELLKPISSDIQFNDIKHDQDLSNNKFYNNLININNLQFKKSNNIDSQINAFDVDKFKTDLLQDNYSDENSFMQPSIRSRCFDNKTGDLIYNKDAQDVELNKNTMFNMDIFNNNQSDNDTCSEEEHYTNQTSNDTCSEEEQYVNILKGGAKPKAKSKNDTFRFDVVQFKKDLNELNNISIDDIERSIFTASKSYNFNDLKGYLSNNSKNNRSSSSSSRSDKKSDSSDSLSESDDDINLEDDELSDLFKEDNDEEDDEDLDKLLNILGQDQLATAKETESHFKKVREPGKTKPYQSRTLEKDCNCDNKNKQQKPSHKNTSISSSSSSSSRNSSRSINNKIKDKISDKNYNSHIALSESLSSPKLVAYRQIDKANVMHGKRFI